MPLWLNLILIIAILLVEFQGWAYLTRACRNEGAVVEGGFLRLFWPLRMSSLLILSGSVYYLHDCLSHPPLGYSRLSVTVSWLVIGLGFFCRNWEK